MINMEVPIQLPAPTLRSGGLFTDVAASIDTSASGRDRLGSGVVHVPWGCDPVYLGNAELCMVDGEVTQSVEDGILAGGTDFEPKDAAIVDYPDQVIHPPFKIVDGLKCSSISFPNDTTPVASIQNRLRNRMRMQMSKMMLAELVAGAASGGPNLASEASALPATNGIYGAAFQVETWLASVLHNAVGAVVLPVGLLSQAVDSGWVNPATMRTMSGHYVIADAGFTGDPSDPVSAAPASFSVFGLGVPGYASSNPVVLEVASGASHIDITSNVIAQLIESYAQLAFEPCTVGETVVSIDFDQTVLVP